MMKLSHFLPFVVGSAVAGVLASAASPAQAIRWTNPSTSITYDVTTITGSFDANSTLITSQPWWGNEINSQNAASTITNGLGISGWYDFGSFGPLFAYNEMNLVNDPNYGNYHAIGGYLYNDTYGVNDTGLGTGGIRPDASAVYAVATTATPVPFDISPAIPTVGSLFVLLLMRKAKQVLVLKTAIADPVETVV